MFYRKRRQPKGVTLIELTIAISIFSVVMMVIFDSFLTVLRNNREAVNKQNIQDHTEFLLSLMSKEVRMAKINYSNNCHGYFSSLTDITNIAPNATYAVADNGRELRLENYEGLCVRYFLESDTALGWDRLKIARHNPLNQAVGGLESGQTKTSWVLPTSLMVDAVNFTAQNKFDNAPVGALHPPMVKFSISLNSAIFEPSNISLATEIVGRNMEQF